MERLLAISVPVLHNQSSSFPTTPDVVQQHYGSKRKLKDMDNHGFDHEVYFPCTCHEDATPVLKYEHVEPTGECDACTEEEFFDRACEIFGQLLDLLAESPPTSLTGLEQFQRKVKDCHGDLISRMVKPLQTYSSNVGAALSLMREQITERQPTSYPGLLRWFATMEVCISDFANYDDEELVLFWKDVPEEMEMQHSIVEYCVEALEEIVCAPDGA